MSRSTYSYLPFETARLRFRAPTKDDSATALERVMDPLCVAHLPHLRNQNHTLETCWAWCELQQQQAEKGEALFVVFERLDTGRVIGDGGVDEFWWEDKDGNRVDAATAQQQGEASGLTKYGEIGCMIESSNDVRGKGFGEEIMRGLMTLGFGETGTGNYRKGLGCDVIIVKTSADNAAMIGLCSRRLRLKGVEKTVDGQQDVWFQVTAEEWRQLNADGRT